MKLYITKLEDNTGFKLLVEEGPDSQNGTFYKSEDCNINLSSEDFSYKSERIDIQLPCTDVGLMVLGVDEDFIFFDDMEHLYGNLKGVGFINFNKGEATPQNVIPVTPEQLQTLAADGNLQPGATYKVAGADDGFCDVYITALATDKIAPTGTGIFKNPNYADPTGIYNRVITGNISAPVGDFQIGERVISNNGFIGRMVSLEHIELEQFGEDWENETSITGENSGATADIANFENIEMPPGTVKIWGNKHWFKSNANNTADPISYIELDSAAWQYLDEGYVEEICEVAYDFIYDKILSKKDTRGNYYETTLGAIEGAPYNPLKAIRYGDGGVIGNRVIGISEFATANIIALEMENNVLTSVYFADTNVIMSLQMSKMNAINFQFFDVLSGIVQMSDCQISDLYIANTFSQIAVYDSVGKGFLINGNLASFISLSGLFGNGISISNNNLISGIFVVEDCYFSGHVTDSETTSKTVSNLHAVPFGPDNRPDTANFPPGYTYYDTEYEDYMVNGVTGFTAATKSSRSTNPEGLVYWARENYSKFTENPLAISRDLALTTTWAGKEQIITNMDVGEVVINSDKGGLTIYYGGALVNAVPVMTGETVRFVCDGEFIVAMKY